MVNEDQVFNKNASLPNRRDLLGFLEFITCTNMDLVSDNGISFFTNSTQLILLALVVILKGGFEIFIASS